MEKLICRYLFLFHIFDHFSYCDSTSDCLPSHLDTFIKFSNLSNISSVINNWFQSYSASFTIQQENLAEKWLCTFFSIFSSPCYVVVQSVTVLLVINTCMIIPFYITYYSHLHLLILREEIKRCTLLLSRWTFTLQNATVVSATPHGEQFLKIRCYPQS